MPEPIMRGKYAIHEHNGGYLIAFQDEMDDGSIQHLEIPAALVTIAKARAEGKRITPKMLMGLTSLGGM